MPIPFDVGLPLLRGVLSVVVIFRRLAIGIG